MDSWVADMFGMKKKKHFFFLPRRFHIYLYYKKLDSLISSSKSTNRIFFPASLILNMSVSKFMITLMSTCHQHPTSFLPNVDCHANIMRVFEKSRSLGPTIDPTNFYTF